MIDAHQHCWQIGLHNCQWPTADLAEIYRDFTVADLSPIASAAGVEGSVLVQSQASDMDTDYLLALAASDEFVRAVVGWVDLASPTAPARIAQLAQHQKLRGLRPMLQNIADDAWILRPELTPALAAMQEQQLCFDALVCPRHLPYLQAFAERYPGLPVVIDHAAKPSIAVEDKESFRAWCEAIKRLAELPNVYCKISGLLTEANAQQGAADLRRYIAHLYYHFGARRLLWGSDWPVLYLSPNRVLGDYGSWLALVRESIPSSDLREREAIFGGTARSFYRFT